MPVVAGRLVMYIFNSVKQHIERKKLPMAETLKFSSLSEKFTFQLKKKFFRSTHHQMLNLVPLGVQLKNSKFFE